MNLGQVTSTTSQLASTAPSFYTTTRPSGLMGSTGGRSASQLWPAKGCSAYEEESYIIKIKLTFRGVATAVLAVSMMRVPQDTGAPNIYD
ncbi:hypothetical protein TNCV_5094431 [Trichonephila clavipes]|nr:hypothetical protein TNCV_5094431 [Trichonephila clavipes]